MYYITSLLWQVRTVYTNAQYIRLIDCIWYFKYDIYVASYL